MAVTHNLRFTTMHSIKSQFTASKDYVTLFVRTPSLAEINKDTGIELGECVGSDVVQHDYKMRSCMHCTCHADESVSVTNEEQTIEEWWLLEHARQVTHLYLLLSTSINTFHICFQDRLACCCVEVCQLWAWPCAVLMSSSKHFSLNLVTVSETLEPIISTITMATTYFCTIQQI